MGNESMIKGVYHMQKILKHVPAIVLAIVLSVGTIANSITIACAANEEVSQIINVTGKGVVKVKPDIAYVSLVAGTKNAIVKTAQSENNIKIKAILEKLKEIGIDEADINTSEYSLKPYYKKDTSSYNTSVIDGYTASCTIRVTVNDLEKVGAAIDSAIESGATNVNNIQFAIADPSPYYAQALTFAGKDAKNKADALATSLGVKINAVLVINEQETYYASVSYNTTSREIESDTVPLGTAVMPVQADELSVTASIKVTFSIK